MFNKLLSNLPFNPSLINQVSFYAQRLKRETAIRRLGLIFVVLAMLVQIVAIMSPPQPSLASSNNDVINGGFGSQYDALAHCVNNTQGYRDILAHFNISCDNVGGGQVVSLNACDYGKQLFSMGRIAYGKAGETPVNINGTNFFLRYLWDWPGGCNDNYQAVRVTSQTGVTAFLLFDCGNPTFVGLPQTPPPPKPVCSNWYLGWGFWYQSPDGDVNKATATTTKDPCAVYPPPACAGWYKGWGFWYQSPDGNVNKATKTTTVDPCVKPPEPPKPVCSNWYLGWGFWYQSPDGNVNKATKTTTTNPCTTPPPVTPPAKCPENSSILATDAKCKSCEKSQTREDKTACLELSKKATNATANISDANDTTAKPGDVINYTLSVKNTGKDTVEKFTIQENISDILDYSDIVNLNGAAKDNNNIIAWPAVSIKSNQTVTKQFSVKVKNPIPSTPTSTSDAGHFDLTMTNVYGNSVTIKLPGSVPKTTEVVATSLPNTGPGTTLVGGFTMTVVIGYFFARRRLMAKELDIIRVDYASGGV